MTRWFTIIAFAGLTFFSLVMRLLLSDPLLELLFCNAYYYVILYYVIKIKNKESFFIKLVLACLSIYYVVLDLYILLISGKMEYNLELGIKTAFSFIFYLTFIIIFKKKGSGFYSKTKKDWLIGFPVGLFTFLTLMFLFSDKIGFTKEPVFFLFAAFLSFFFILGVNISIPKKNYYILCLGLLLNFISILIGIYLYQESQVPHSQILLRGLFTTSIFCLLEGYYGLIGSNEAEKNIDLETKLH